MDWNESISLYCSFPWIQDIIQSLILLNYSIVLQMEERADSFRYSEYSEFDRTCSRSMEYFGTVWRVLQNMF